MFKFIFDKAYWRKAQVLQVLKRPHLACHTYLTGLAYSENPVEFLSQAVKQLENNIQQKKYGKFVFGLVLEF